MACADGGRRVRAASVLLESGEGYRQHADGSELVNLKLMAVSPWAEQDLTGLKQYCQQVRRRRGVPIRRTILLR